MADIESPDRVGVKVWPDTRGFLKDLRATLKKVEKQVRVNVPVVADGKGLARDAKAATVAASRAAGAIKAEVELEDGFLAKMRRDLKSATAKLEAEVPLTADGERLRRDARAKIAELQARMSQMALEVPLDPEAAAAQKADLKREIAELQAVASADAVEVPVRPAVDHRALRQMQQEVHKTVSGVRAPAVSMPSLPSMSGLPKIIAITTLILAVTNLIPVIATLGVGLAQMVPLLLAVPALAVGAAAGIATLVVGLSGVGGAFAAAGEGGEAFEKALSKIAPNARDFVRKVHSLADGFKELQLDVQNALFEGLGSQIRRLGEAYLPVLTKGMTGLASEIGGVVKSWSRMARSQRSLDDTSTMFEDIRDAVDRATPGLTSFSDGMRTLARIGTGFLPGLADGFTNLGERFRDWVNAGDESGSIEKSISDAGEAAEKVGRVFSGLAGIIGGLFTGAVGAGDPLGALGDSLHRVSDIVNGPAFQKGLGEFFQGVSDGMAGLGEALPDVADALVAIAPGLGSLVRGFGEGLGGAISAVAGFIEEHAETFNRFAQWFEDLDPVIQAAIVGVMLFAPVAMSIASAIAPALVALGGLISSFGWVVLGIGLVIGAIAGLAIGFWQLYENSETVRGAVAGVQQALSDMWAVVQPILLQIRNEIMAQWPEMGATAQQAWSTIVTVVTTALQFLQLAIQSWTIVIGALWSMFGETFLATLRGFMSASAEVFSGALNVIQGLFTAFSAVMSGDWSSLWSGLQQMLAGYLQAMGGLVSMGFALINGIVQASATVVLATVRAAWSAITSTFQAQMALAASLVSAGMAAVQSTFSAGVSGAQAIVAGGLSALVSMAAAALAPLVGVVTGITSGMNAAFSGGLASMAGTVVSALSGLPGLLFSIGSSMISLLASGMISQLGRVASAAASVAQSIRNRFPGSPVKEGPLKSWNHGGGVTGAGRRLIGGLADGMEAELQAVSSAARRVAGAATPALSGAPLGGSFAGMELTGTLDTPWGPAEVRGIVRDELVSQARQARVQGAR